MIVDNIIRNNIDQSQATEVTAISASANDLNHRLLKDYGRSTGEIDLITQYRDNQGPLIRGNRLADNEGERANGSGRRSDDTKVCGTTPTWCDVVFDEILVPDFHTFGVDFAFAEKKARRRVSVIQLSGVAGPV